MAEAGSGDAFPRTRIPFFCSEVIRSVPLFFAASSASVQFVEG